MHIGDRRLVEMERLDLRERQAAKFLGTPPGFGSRGGNSAWVNLLFTLESSPGTRKSLAIYVVRDPHEIEGIARLGPDPLADEFTLDVLSRILHDAGRAQIKGVLRHQGTIAGIGNAYSDELLHAAKMSPFKPSSSLSDDELATLYTAIRTVLGDAVKRSSGLPASELKGEKKTHLAVHGRKGATCPVCGDVVREVSFADTFLNYCATCQTGGKPLADRRTSKFLK